MTSISSPNNSTKLSLGLTIGMPLKSDIVMMGNSEYNSQHILKEILTLKDNSHVYIHGSNSASLDLFKNLQKPGFLLAKSELTAQGIECGSGECSQLQFRDQYEETGHTSIFAYKITDEDDAYNIDRVADYAGYNTSNNKFYPVIYILDEHSDFSEKKYGEYSSNNSEIPPANIKGIMAPTAQMATVTKLLAEYNFNNITVLPMD